MRIRITWDFGEVFADLDDTPTARAVLDALPIRSTADTWGEEVYLGARLAVQSEDDARQVVEPGTVCYWVEGASLALPFGPTPISEAGESRLVSPCNVLGRLEGNPRALGRIRAGHLLTVSRA
jgi:uncharacterized protein